MRAWVLIALAACGAETPPANVDGYDVIVSSTGIVVWAGFTDVLAHDGHFPAPGACGGFGDTAVISQSCFGSLSVDGIPIASRDSIGPVNPFGAELVVTPTSVLTASDCDRTIEIPLHAGPYPIATNVAAMQSGTDLIVTWTSDAPFTLVTHGTGYAVDECLDQNASSHRFADSGAVSGGEVQALSAPETTESALGEVRVWYGDSVGVTTPSP